MLWIRYGIDIRFYTNLNRKVNGSKFQMEIIESDASA